MQENPFKNYWAVGMYKHLTAPFIRPHSSPLRRQILLIIYVYHSLGTRNVTQDSIHDFHTCVGDTTSVQRRPPIRAMVNRSARLFVQK